MNLRVRSRAWLTRVLFAVIGACSLIAVLLLTDVSPSKSDPEETLKKLVNNDPGEPIQPLNMSAALQNLRSSGSDYTFEWSHWANLANSELYDYGNLDPAFYPYLSTVDDLSKITLPFTVATTQREAAMIGELYCRHRMPAPARIIALMQDSTNMSQIPAEVWSVHHSNGEFDHLQYGQSEPVEQPVSTNPLAADLASSDASVKLLPEISDNLFHWDAREAAEKLEQGDTFDQAHAKTLRAAISHAKTSGKHFEETHLLFDSGGLGNHHDWRFFRGMQTYPERTQTIQALVRTWNQFSSQFGIESWWAHGSALGWMWNGLSMPWDLDGDIQMPIQTLDRLAREFNATLIVQSPNEGSRAYWLEVSPWYVERTHGNWMNVIDARFIDITTGNYIDITGLAYYGKNSKVACKNVHYYWYNEISPLRQTKFEGTTAYIPAQFPVILKAEYAQAYKPIFEDWKFNAKTHLWSSTDTDCKQDDLHFDRAICYPVDLLPWTDCKYTLYGTCNRIEIEEYETTKDYTLAHELEMDLWEQVPIDDLQSARSSPAAAELIEHLKEDFPPMHRSAN